MFLSFTSLQVFQLWSHSVDTLLDKARAGSPAPTSNPCLSSHFLDEHCVLASFWPLLSHLLLCSALPLAFPQPCSESFLLYFTTLTSPFSLLHILHLQSVGISQPLPPQHPCSLSPSQQVQGPQGTNVLLHVFPKCRGAVLALPVLSAGGSPGLLRAALWSGVLPCSPTPLSHPRMNANN